MSVGRPIVYQGSKDGEIARMIIEFGNGRVVRPNQPDQLEAAILSYYHNPDVVKTHGKRSYRLAQTIYSKKNSVTRYNNLIQTFMNKKAF